MTIELIRRDVDTAEILYEKEATEAEHAGVLYRYRLRAELLNRDRDGEYQARVRPEPEEKA